MLDGPRAALGSSKLLVDHLDAMKRWLSAHPSSTVVVLERGGGGHRAFDDVD